MRSSQQGSYTSRSLLDEEEKKEIPENKSGVYSPKSSNSQSKEKITIKGLISSRRAEQPSILKQVTSVDLRVCPMIAIDFSTTNQNEKRHSQDVQEPNEYREILQSLATSYGNVLNLPVFGYGAKTSPFLD